LTIEWEKEWYDRISIRFKKKAEKGRFAAILVWRRNSYKIDKKEAKNHVKQDKTLQDIRILGTVKAFLPFPTPWAH